MTDLQWWLCAVLFAFALGVLLGNRLEAQRWADNADEIQRKHFRGKLYKVYHE